jgi:lipoxygenase
LLLRTLSQDPYIKKLDATHRQKLAKLEKTFEQRNRDVSKNWARKQPYELLMPSSGPGVTGRGVPYSVSI